MDQCAHEKMVKPCKNLQSFLSLANESPDLVSIIQPSKSNARIFFFSLIATDSLDDVEASFTIRASFSTMCQVLGSREVNFFDIFIGDESSLSATLFITGLEGLGTVTLTLCPVFQLVDPRGARRILPTLSHLNSLTYFTLLLVCTQILRN